MPPVEDDEASASQKMVRLVCTCALGFAVIGFVCLLLALAGIFVGPAIAAALVLCFAAASAAHRESPFARPYWIKRGRAVAGSWDAPILALYYFLLILAYPDINLNRIGADANAYHLAYAADWANAGRLVVDPFLDPPFYASNFSLLFSALLIFRGAVFVIFLVWICGLFTVLGLFAGTRWLLADVPRVWADSAALLLTLSLVLAPSYYNWLNSAYIDVPFGAFTLITVLALALGVRERRWSWLAASAVIAGFLIGMKSSFLPLVAVFGIATWAAGRSLSLSFKSLSGILALLLICSSPWYVRNLIAAGDPMPPVLNMTIYKHDGLMTRFEVLSLTQQLHAVKSPADLLSLPYRALTQYDGPNFNSDGTTSLILGLYLLAAAALLALILNRKMGREVWISLFVLTALALYWSKTSTSLRYANMFMPLLALCTGTVTGALLRGTRWRGPAVALVALLTLVPSSGTMDYLHRRYDVDFRGLADSYVSDDLTIEGYPEAKFTINLLRRLNARGSVYVVDVPRGENLHYFFRRHGMMNPGTWTGPGSWFRLYNAVQAGEASEFLSDLKVSAVLVGQSRMLFNSLSEPLTRQLVAAGFCGVPIPESTDFTVYVHCTALHRATGRA